MRFDSFSHMLSYWAKYTPEAPALRYDGRCWSYGDLYREAHENGSPLIRTMFYEFPEDQKCWELQDQYMFGSRYLVAPVLHLNEFERDVYLPAGMWENVNTGERLEGGKTVRVPAPIDEIPVFRRSGS